MVIVAALFVGIVLGVLLSYAILQGFARGWFG